MRSPPPKRPQPQGRDAPARSWSLPPWLTIATVTLLVPLAAICVWSGWELYSQSQLAGSRAHWAEPREADQSRWSGFLHLAKTREHRTLAELKRRAALARALRLGVGGRATASSLMRGSVRPSWEEAARRRGPSTGTLLWPVEEGLYVRGYGSGEGGYHLAVDIMAKRGTPVLAAESGMVGYAGNAVRGYGNLIMLIHPGGGVTSYAHNEVNHVVAGELVARGQVIADLGNTGISRGPHVHFEFMRAGNNCDPAPLFRPAVRHRKGHLNPVEQVTWGSDEPRPPQVACGRRRRHPRSRYAQHKPTTP